MKGFFFCYSHDGNQIRTTLLYPFQLLPIDYFTLPIFSDDFHSCGDCTSLLIASYLCYQIDH